MTKPTIVISVNAAWNLVNFRQSLLRSLVAGGYHVVAVAPPDGREGELAALGVDFVPIRIDRRGMSPIADAGLLLAYLRILGRLKPCAYLGFTVKPNVYGGMACRMLGIPRIANIAGLGTAFLKRGALNWVVRQLYATGLKGARRVFFQNPDDRAHFLAEGLTSEDRTGLLPGSGVDLARFVPRYRAHDGRIVFLLVTRLLRAKGVAEYVEAAELMRRRHGDAVAFRMLGIPDHSPGGVDAETLDRWRRNGAVELIDPVSDVRPIVADADCVVLPSYYPEGTPRSLLEAAGMGKAIITTDTPGCRDVVEQGVNGFLCKARSIPSLVDAMEAYRTLDAMARSNMGVASRVRAERDYDERIILERYARELRALQAG
ncbi:Glycosyltransferase involved in cell wall bisynthesis [Sphingomonas gellani]|uniref:Glycosyltransferase involved in cell wall bisynthesis n=1 Tax=Sphingomonas gellani TaxID=1166340 RepID=A0A1H8I622_9SPHN|nr:glycosyltransferase family 4 protein [Sphingomonas gellani]SEN63288.1 Glycosyltransferase involved in cell wall bisynthesis [Sphingomonas gellani]